MKVIAAVLATTDCSFSEHHMIFTVALDRAYPACILNAPFVYICHKGHNRVESRNCGLCLKRLSLLSLYGRKRTHAWRRWMLRMQRVWSYDDDQQRT